MKKPKVNKKVYIRGYENGCKVYRRFKGRYFNDKFIPKDITDTYEKCDYANGWFAGWDDAQKQDITVNP